MKHSPRPKSLTQTALGHDIGPFRDIVSVGMTTVQHGDIGLKRILKRTDETLYLAKQQGPELYKGDLTSTP